MIKFCPFVALHEISIARAFITKRRIRGRADKFSKSAKFIGTAKGQNEILDRLGVDRSGFTDLFSACLGCGARVQEMGSKLIVKGRRRSVDLSAVRSVSAMMRRALFWYIGSEASGSRTWLWGYENINRLDERLLALARDVRDFGLRNGLAELGTPKLALSAEINGHAPSAIACGLSQEPLCYYCCPHAGGAVFVAFAAGECVSSDGTIKLGMDASDLISLARDYIGAFQLNHAVLLGGAFA